MARLTDTALKSLGIEEKDLRRLILAALKKANWNLTDPTGVQASAHPKVGDIKSVGSAALPSTSGPGRSKPKVRLHSPYQDDSIGQLTPWQRQASTTASPGSTTAQKRKRSTVDDELPDRPPEEVESAKYGNFDFEDVLNEDVLKIKSTVINRAPVMTAWATIVAERLGFGREEALSIGE